MTQLRDARLRRAMDAAPDAGLRPGARTREAILAGAAAAVQPRWKRWWAATGERRTPWAAAFATVALATLITVLWQGREIPGVDETPRVPAPAAPAPAPQAAPPAAMPAPVLVAPPATEAAPRAAPPVARSAPGAAQDARDAVGQGRASRDTRREAVPRRGEAPPRQEATPQVGAAAAPPPPASPAAAPAPPPPSPPAPPAPPPPPAPAVAPPPPTPAAAPPLPPSAAPEESRADAAAAERPRMQAAPAPPLAPGLRSAVALPDWNQVRIEAGGRSVRLPRAEAGALPALIGRLGASAPELRASAPESAAGEQGASLRLELADDSRPVGVLQWVDGRWRWTPATDGARTRTLRVSAELSAALRQEVERLSGR